MITNIVKFSESEWVVVPIRTTPNEIVDYYIKLSIDNFKDLLSDFIINDNEGKPDIIEATRIVRKLDSSIKEITFELYSIE